MDYKSRHSGISAFAFIASALLGLVAVGADADDVVVSIDRTTLDWSDLGMGAPTTADDADQAQNPRAVFSYVPAFGKPHADAGASELKLPRLNDGKLPRNNDDNANNTWFDTAENSRILVDLGESKDIARINVYSWHSGALSPQQYTLWAAVGDAMPDATPEDLANDWHVVAKVNTHSLGEGGKHGSSINGKQGTIGKYRYLLFDLPANRPDWSRSGFISEIDVYEVGHELEQVRSVSRGHRTGSQTLKFGDIRLTKPLKEPTPFLLSGTKLYEYAAMDGTFPEVGRLDGDQGGIWCHPIKLLNKFEYTILEEGQNDLRLQGPDSQFTHKLASCEFNFSRNDLTITRRDFVPEEEPALVSSLTVRNETDKPRVLTVRFSATVNIRPSYESQLPNGTDVVEYRDGLVGAFDSEMKDHWGVVFGSDHPLTDHRIEGQSGVLTYALTLPARDEANLHFLIVGEHQDGVEAARARFKSMLGRTPELLAQKEALYQDRILDGVKFSCSDSAMNHAFLCAKANVMMSVMDLRPGYPAPFLAAGFPIYTWLFGCDSLHSTVGVAAAGFDDAARGTLECLLHFADQKKQGAHEVASNGRLLGWDHIQETPQLVAACWKHFQWTGDRSFLTKAYPVCREMIAHVLATADQDHDGYLEGPGLMEQAGMGPERIDSVCQLYAAYESLACMAEVLGESGADEYRLRAVELKRNFNRDWWNPLEKMWACSLRKDGTQTMNNFWAVVFPQQTGIAELDKATIALERIEQEWVNDQWGFVAQWKPTIIGDGVGVVHNNVLAQTAFSYGKTELGWKLLQLSAKAPLEERMLGAFDETTPGGGDLMQLWSFGPFFEAIVEGMAGVRPQRELHRVDLFPQLPGSLEWFKLEDCRIGTSTLAIERRRSGQNILTTVTHSNGNTPLSGTYWLPTDTGDTVKINGQVIKAERQQMLPTGMELQSINYELQPGASLVIEQRIP